MKQEKQEKQLWLAPTAHRGLHGEKAPENSLPAFQEAIDKGYAIETDVHMTKDKRLVLFHDDCLFRMTGDRRRVFECTYEEISALRLSGTEEKIPLLEELLRLDGGRAPILLEIKNEPKESTREFLSEISAAFSKYPGVYAVQSFQPMYVRGYKKLCPNVSCGLLTLSDPNPKIFLPPFAKLKRHIVANMSLNFFVKPDFLSFEFHSPTKKVKKFKGKKFCWTVRSEEDEKRGRSFADNIIFENYLP